MANSILVTLRIYIDLIIDFFFSLYWDGARKAIPSLEKNHSILKESAVVLAEKIRKGELKSEKLVTACIQRIKIVNPIINSITDERFDDALKEARQIDKLIEGGLDDEYFKQRPFLGVPFTAKESHAVKGLLYTMGSLLRRHCRAEETSESAQRMIRAGAIPLALTTVPEFNFWQETRSMLWGQTNNPYHTGRTVGGSSGGESSLNACLATPISLCSDIGGSTRMPAFYSGLFGHNPTSRCTSSHGSFLRTDKHPTISSTGFLSRHCADLIPLTKVIAGDKAPLLNLERKVDIKDIKIYYVESSNDIRVSPISQELKKAMNRVIIKLTQDAPNSASVPQKYYNKGFDSMFSLWKYKMSFEAEYFPKMVKNNMFEAMGLWELAKKLVGRSEHTLGAIFKVIDDQLLPKPNAEWAEAALKQLKEDLTRTLGTNSVLLFPSAPHTAPWHGSAFLRPFNFAYWAVFNALELPATQIPLGLDSQGMPLGIQVVAAPHQDALCLEVAKHLEKLFGGYVPPCQIEQD